MASPFTPATIPSTFNGGTITTGLKINPATDAAPALELNLPAAATNDPIHVYDSLLNTVFAISAPTGGGMIYTPDNNHVSSTFWFKNNGDLSLKNAAGTEYLSYTNSNGILQLDPDNGQVYVKSGNLVTAGSEPADATLTFNGCVSLYVEGSSLKAKAKIGGVFVHATIGVFT